MLNLTELEQFVAFSKLGTLTKVADAFHISTPSVTRSMQNLEDAFQVSLFDRTKNKITLTPTGERAASLSDALLKNAAQTIQSVQEYDRSLKTLTVKSCAPAPLWTLLPELSQKNPSKTISSNICQNEEVLESLSTCACDFAILPFRKEIPGYQCREFMKEHLFVCVPSEHELSHHPELSFAQINGFNFLLRSELGFWDTLCRQKMPASKFLVQPEEATFQELVRSTSLPCFSTDYGMQHLSPFRERVNIPMSDPEAKVTFYLYNHIA